MKLSSKSKTQLTGKLFEEQAKQFLLMQQFEFIEANSHCKFGELDLIMLDDQTLCFIEVRYRGLQSKTSALASIDHRKQKKIQKSAQFWLLNNPQYQQRFCRFDCIGIEPTAQQAPTTDAFNASYTITHNQQDYRLSWVKNAFM